MGAARPGRIWLQRGICVCKNNCMSAVSPVARFRDVAPELVQRLGWIVAGLASVVARRFLKEPKFFALIIPLWGWLGRSGRRFGRMKVGQALVPAVRQVRAARVVKARVVKVRLPSGRGWLVRALGYEAAGYGSQLAVLLAEPELQALLLATPAAGRILRPLCRMLGVEPVGALAPAVVADAPVRARRVRPTRVRIPLPGSTRPYICGPKAPVLKRG